MIRESKKKLMNCISVLRVHIGYLETSHLTCIFIWLHKLTIIETTLIFRVLIKKIHLCSFNLRESKQCLHSINEHDKTISQMF